MAPVPIGWNAFADHVSPVLAFFGYLYQLAPTPLWLFAAQAVAFGAGYLELEPLFDAVGLPGSRRAALRIAYIVNPLLWEIGHVAWFQEYWTLRHAMGEPPVRADADALELVGGIDHGKEEAALRVHQLLRLGDGGLSRGDIRVFY